MADDIKKLTNCCSCCCGPTRPSLKSFREDQIAARAVTFIEGVALKHAEDWDLAAQSEPNLMADKQDLHIFHESNTLPVIKSFYNGKAKDLWRGDSTPHFNEKNFEAPIPRDFRRARDIQGADFEADKFVGNIPDDMLFFSTTKNASYRAVQWEHPTPLKGFKPLTDLIIECINNVGSCREPPNYQLLVPGCKSCNDIMTLEATTSHFLVREVISSKPLVPSESILSLELKGTATSGNLQFVDLNSNTCRWDPNERNRGGNPNEFTYQACLAYYIHRCMPAKPVDRVFKKNKEKNTVSLHCVNAAFSFLVLEIACLWYERYQGCQGGKAKRTKPAYRYRGCAEMYLSYLFWCLLRIDNIAGVKEGKNGNHCTIDFAEFHRYIFLDVLRVLVLKPEFAADYEILDAVFGGNLLVAGGGEALVIGSPVPEPEKKIKHMCKSIPLFYRGVIKPIFSRHMASLEPNHDLLDPADDSEDDEKNELLYSDQVLCYNMVIEKKSITNVLHLIEKSIVGELDTFINTVGIHAVLSRWLTYLDMAPRRISNLLRDYMDDETCKEYRNIQSSMRPDEFQPTISKEAAETIYEMCNALELPSEPSTQEELELLRISVKCSEMKAIERLAMLGAFNKEEEGKK